MKRLLLILLLCGTILGCGSSNNDLERVNREQAATIQSLNEEIIRLNQEIDQLRQAGPGARDYQQQSGSMQYVKK